MGKSIFGKFSDLASAIFPKIYSTTDILLENVEKHFER